MMDAMLSLPQLGDRQFQTIRARVYDICRINLHAGKENLVRARLGQRLRALGLHSFDDYIDYLNRDIANQEIDRMIDILTTNKTSFFREAQHFDFLKQQAMPELVESGRMLRFWSAGCSTGEEPYSMAITLKEATPRQPDYDMRILATDISTRVLARAREGLYNSDVAREIPPGYLKSYFQSRQEENTIRVKTAIKSLVRFARLNLNENWPMKGPFDVIFCRNVMIYFDKATQQNLIERFWRMLRPGGFLFIGHSESLITSVHKFKYVQPAIYQK